MNTSLRNVKNISEIIEERLKEIGVFLFADQTKMTPVAYRKICGIYPKQSLL